MFRPALVLTLVCLVGASAVPAQVTGEKPEDSMRIEWINDFEDARAEALSQNKLILLDFYSDT